MSCLAASLSTPKLPLDIHRRFVFWATLGFSGRWALWDRARRRVAESLNDTKALQNNAGVVVDGECGLTERLPHFIGVPKPLVTRSPLGDRVETLALIDHMQEVDTSEPNDLDACGLNDCHGLIFRIDDDRTKTRYWERAGFQFVFTQEACRRHLVATEDGRHECVPKESRKGEFRPCEILMGHDTTVTSRRRGTPRSALTSTMMEAVVSDIQEVGSMGFFGKAIYSDGRWSEVATANMYLSVDVHDSSIATIVLSPAGSAQGIFVSIQTPSAAGTLPSDPCV
jgi:hypothetical protein